VSRLHTKATRSVALTLVGIFATSVALEHALATGLNPRRHMISEYANTTGLAGALMTGAFFGVS
jgi:hypothetical protein